MDLHAVESVQAPVVLERIQLRPHANRAHFSALRLTRNRLGHVDPIVVPHLVVEDGRAAVSLPRSPSHVKEVNLAVTLLYAL